MEPADTRHATNPLPWHPGSRMARLRASHSYRPVLYLIVVSFVFMAAAPAEEWARSVFVLLECATLVTALWTAGLGRDRRAVVALIVISGATAIAGLVFNGGRLDGFGWLLGVALVAATVFVIGLGMIDQGEVNRQTVIGAVCIYLLLGIFFTFVYGAVASLQSADFFAQGTDGTTSIRLYFSFVTLATLGYGDYTPGADLGRTLAVVETLIGQLYLVTVVALLVSHLGRARRPLG